MKNEIWVVHYGICGHHTTSINRSSLDIYKDYESAFKKYSEILTLTRPDNVYDLYLNDGTIVGFEPTDHIDINDVIIDVEQGINPKIITYKDGDDTFIDYIEVESPTNGEYCVNDDVNYVSIYMIDDDYIDEILEYNKEMVSSDLTKEKVWELLNENYYSVYESGTMAIQHKPNSIYQILAKELQSDLEAEIY